MTYEIKQSHCHSQFCFAGDNVNTLLELVMILQVPIAKVTCHADHMCGDEQSKSHSVVCTL